jgi:monoterpene epsilon-lactone hydrolase
MMRSAMVDAVEQAERDRLFHILNRNRAALSLEVPLKDRRAALNGRLLPLGEDVVICAEDVAGIPAEWISTPGAGPNTVFYVHGGGFTMGGLSDAREFVTRISRAAGAKVLHPDYRLAPEHPFPAALNDLRTAYQWLAETQASQQIVVMGDSAGGGLALSLVMSLRDEGADLPVGLVMMSPWVDLAMQGMSYTERADRDPLETAGLLQWCAKAYAGEASLLDPRVSPLYGDFAGLPSMMVLVGSEEMMFDDSIEIAGKARAQGVDTILDVAEGMPHVYPRFASILKEGQRAVDRMGAFVKARVHGER